jgi:hypothetical protein
MKFPILWNNSLGKHSHENTKPLAVKFISVKLSMDRTGPQKQISNKSFNVKFKMNLHWEIDCRNLSEVCPIISENFIGSDKFIG